MQEQSRETHCVQVRESPPSPLTFTDPWRPAVHSSRERKWVTGSSPLSQPQTQRGRPCLAVQRIAVRADSGSSASGGGRSASTARGRGRWLGVLPSLSRGPTPADGPARLSLPRDGPAHLSAGRAGPAHRRGWGRGRGTGAPPTSVRVPGLWRRYARPRRRNFLNQPSPLFAEPQDKACPFGFGVG